MFWNLRITICLAQLLTSYNWNTFHSLSNKPFWSRVWITCIIQTKKSLLRLLLSFAPSPGSSHSWQNSSCSNLVTPVGIGYTTYSFLHPLTFTGRKCFCQSLKVRTVTKLSECSWQDGRAPEQLLIALSPLPCLPFHHVSSGKILSTANQEDFSS